MLLQEKKILIATRLKKTIDTTNALLFEINEVLEGICKDNEQMLVLSRVFRTWVDKVEKT